MTRAILPQRTALRHVHPALTIEQQFSPFRLIVAWDGMEIGTVTDYLSAEQLGRDWLEHLLNDDAMDAPGVHMAWCPHAEWWVQPIDTQESGWPGVVWWTCPACDCNERPRWHPDFSAANPGPHLLDLNKTTTPPVYQFRYEEVSA